MELQGDAGGVGGVGLQGGAGGVGGGSPLPFLGGLGGKSPPGNNNTNNIYSGVGNIYSVYRIYPFKGMTI